MANRYTVRSYETDKQIPEKDLKMILEAGLLAPSKNFIT
jgi:nitroreductase